MEENRVEFSPVEKNVTFSATEPGEPLPQVLDEKSQSILCALIFALPHGQLATSRTIEGMVETFNNVAFQDKLAAIGSLACASVE